MIVESHWCMVLRKSTSQFLRIRRHHSTQSRVAISMTAETIQSMIKDTSEIPADAPKIFDHCDVIAVTDEHRSNIAAEHNLQDTVAENETTLHIICDIHK